ncbi:MAG TPA: acetamidase/formamidase family protein [Acidimicrobiales bacterium]|jgi:acetamidase/formamidase|nr:acetamidase/formamidase family protein [Acidimicrobiales bacterium]
MPAKVTEHHLGRAVSHQFWDRDLEPELVVRPGSEVGLSLRDGSNGQITPGTAAQDLLALDFTQMDPLTGPVFVEGAHPGDALAVEIGDISLAAWGWSGILPGLGLLADHFPGPLLKFWDLQLDYVEVGPGARFAQQPMLGVIGVAPPLPGRHSSVVPTRAGGNIDVKYTRTGSRVLLPVFVEGGLLSLGDAHALQGDGELSGTAIECEADVVVKLEVIRDAGLTAPVIDTAEAGEDPPEPRRSFLGVGPDLWEATREASLRAVEALAGSLKIEPDEAYALLGTFAELRIHEIVDRPNWVVGCMVPLRLLT